MRKLGVDTLAGFRYLEGSDLYVELEPMQLDIFESYLNFLWNF